MTEERRLVTVLFADVVGSTALGEALDPEDVRALLGRMFAIARESIERHGGTLEKFIGDAVMAVFGLPAAHDDDPARACSAALEFRDGVRDDPILGHRLEIRLGVNTGEVIASRDPGAGETLVTGDAVNTAARLEQAADAGTILVGERTAAALGGRFRLGEVVDVAAKGKAEPIRARALEGAPAQPVRQDPHRLIGRAADLSQLRLAADRAFDERRPFLVSIIAPAGIGKSRLLEEFLAGLDPATTVALAQCLPYGQRLTYWPLRAILLSILHLDADAPPDTLRSAVGEWLAATGEPDSESTADLLAATVGAAEAEFSDRIAVFAAWRRFVELVAERSPLVLVIEDLHWSADSLLDLVEAMLQPRADVPLLMVALARPELLDRRPSWAGGRRNAITIDLEPLPVRAVRELVADLLDDPADDLVQAIVERADGNPFFAGEIVRSLEPAAGSSHDPEAIARAVAAIPDTVHATVLARLDGLDPTARRVVQLGAVLGRSFDLRAMSALGPDLPTDGLAAAVDDLVDRDFVRRSSDDTATFRHILIREVAYATLPRRERARLHAAAGTWLEGRALATGREDELAELVAFHLREAALIRSLVGADSAGDDDAAAELPARAVLWLRRAAEAANAGAAIVEADRHLESAIELSPASDQADLYERLGQIWVGNDQALRAFERALALGQERQLGADQELRTMAQSMIVIARWYGALGMDVSTFTSRYGRLRELVQDPDVSLRSRALGHLAIGLGTPSGLSTGDVVDADPVALDDALALARELDDADLVSACLDAMTGVAINGDGVEAATAFVEERRAIAHRLSLPERLDILNMTAWIELLRGRLDVSEQAAAQVREGLGPGQATAWTLGASAWRAVALQMVGRWPEALSEARLIERDWMDSELAAPGYAAHGLFAARAIARAQGDGAAASHWEGLTRTLLDRLEGRTRLHRLRADLDDDLPGLYDEVVVHFRDYPGRIDYVELALSRLADERYPCGADLVEDVVAYAASRHVVILEAAARRALGRQRDDPAELALARELYVGMGARPNVARVDAELGLLTGDAALVGAAIASLEAIGDVLHAGRVAAEARERDLLA